jgi:predicted nuclease of predicted toxin-antitoxin system
MRLLVDMNLTPRWVSRLRAGGHDALHWSEAGHHAATDHEIFEYARVHRRVLLSMTLIFRGFSRTLANQARASSFCAASR